MFYLSHDTVVAWGRRMRPPDMMDDHIMIMWHYRLVMRCVWIIIMPNRPIVSQDHGMTIQQAGGSYTAAPGDHRAM